MSDIIYKHTKNWESFLGSTTELFRFLAEKLASQNIHGREIDTTKVPSIGGFKDEIDHVKVYACFFMLLLLVTTPLYRCSNTSFLTFMINGVVIRFWHRKSLHVVPAYS